MRADYVIKDAEWFRKNTEPVPNSNGVKYYDGINIKIISSKLIGTVILDTVRQVGFKVFPRVLQNGMAVEGCFIDRRITPEDDSEYYI